VGFGGAGWEIEWLEKRNGRAVGEAAGGEVVGLPPAGWWWRRRHLGLGFRGFGVRVFGGSIVLRA
jgi:hypothetical protein